MNVDSLNMGIIVAVLIAISILLRSYLLLKYNWVGKDVFYHLLIAKEIRKNKKLPETVNYFIFPEKYNYPPFLHVFLSLFKEKYHQKLQFLSIIFDIVTGILIFIMVMHTFNIWIAIFSTTLYLITPISIDNSFTLGPRSIANMYMVAALFSLFYFFNTQIVIFAILAAIFTAFVLLTHRLTTQSLLFVLVSMSFGFKSITPLVIILIGIILAIIFSKGYYVKSAKGHINFIKCMAKGFQDRKTRLITPNILPNPIQFVFNMPILLALPVFSLFYDNIITKYFVIWGLSIVILSIIWVYGEGYRHIYNAIPPFSIIVSLWILNNTAYHFFIFIIIISFCFILIKFYRLENDVKSYSIISKEMIDAFNYLKKNGRKDDVVLCLPFDIFYAVIYFTGLKVLQMSGGEGKGVLFNRSILLKKVNEGKIEELIKEFNVKWILFIINNKYELHKTPVFRSQNILLYKT